MGVHVHRLASQTLERFGVLSDSLRYERLASTSVSRAGHREVVCIPPARRISSQSGGLPQYLPKTGITVLLPDTSLPYPSGACPRLRFG